MPDSNLVDDALFDALRGDATLASRVLGGWHRDVAPAGSLEPHGIVSLQAASDERVFEGRGAEEIRYLVKVVGTARPAVKSANERLDAFLESHPPLAATGYAAVVMVGRESRVAYTERDGDVEYAHRGGIYLVEAIPS